MAKVITFGIQKGGAGKTTTAAITAYMLAQAGNKVLAIDLDSQGNLTEMLTQQDIENFAGATSLTAMQKCKTDGCIYRVSDNLDIMPAEDLLATYSRWLYSDYQGNKHTMVLKDTIDPIKANYDYIIIDTPPALGDQTINALAASDAVVVMFETSKFCYSALGRFIENTESIKEHFNPGLKVAGILRCIVDHRRADAKAMMELVEEEYPGMVFASIINRRAFIGRLSIIGFLDNPEIKQVMAEHEDFLGELLDNV
jgi:chromosome partitioning protein